MRLRVERAICGHKSGGHALLSSSISDSELARLLPGLTDLPLDPPHDTSWQPFFRCFPNGDGYLVMKTFYDTTAPRPGMVRTFIVRISLLDSMEIPNLSLLLGFLPTMLEEQWSTESGEIELATTLASAGSEPAGYAELVSALLRPDPLPIVFLGQEGFIELVDWLWRHLWPAAKAQLRIGFHFSPRGLSNHTPSVISVLETYASRWSAYPIVRKDDSPPAAASPAEAYLRGLPNGEPIHQLFGMLNCIPTGIGDLRKAELCVGYLDHKAICTAGELRTLLQFFAQLAPRPIDGAQLKSQILELLITATRAGSVEDVLALRSLYGLNFAGFQNTADALVSYGLEKALPQKDLAAKTGNLIFEATKKLDAPWSIAVLGAIQNLFTAWRDQYAPVVIEWFRSKGEIFNQIGESIPKTAQVESSLAQEASRPLNATAAQRVREFAAQRHWFTLHAAACASSMTAPQAFAAQLAIDPDDTKGVRFLRDHYPKKDTVAAALSTNNDRLIEVASEACCEDPSLLDPWKVEDPSWQNLLSGTLQSSISCWRKIEHPRDLMISLLGLLIEKKKIKDDLLKSLADTEEADLTDYAHRAEIWKLLPSGVRGSFLATTARGWCARYQKEPGFQTSIESELSQEIFSFNGTRLLLDAKSPNASAIGLQAFRDFSQLNETHMISWIGDLVSARSALDRHTSKEIGTLVLSKNWSRVAEKIYDVCAHAPAFKPAATECVSLLGFLKGFFAKFQLGQSIVKSAEFWKVFEEVAVDLYPQGPTDRGLWSRAEGKESDLALKQTGKAQWSQAVKLLRDGGGGNKLSIKTVLGVMRQDFAHNGQVRELEEISRKM